MGCHSTVIKLARRIWKTTQRTKKVLWCVLDFVSTPSHNICLYKLFATLDFTLDKKSRFAFQVQLKYDNYSYSNATLHTKTFASNERKARQAVWKGKAKQMNGWWKFLNGCSWMDERLMKMFEQCVIPENIHTPPPPPRMGNGNC